MQADHGSQPPNNFLRKEPKIHPAPGPTAPSLTGLFLVEAAQWEALVGHVTPPLHQPFADWTISDPKSLLVRCLLFGLRPRKQTKDTVRDEAKQYSRKSQVRRRPPGLWESRKLKDKYNRDETEEFSSFFLSSTLSPSLRKMLAGYFPLRAISLTLLCR